MGSTRSMYALTPLTPSRSTTLTEPLQSMETPITLPYLPPSPPVDTFSVMRSLPSIWLINLEVPSSTPPASRSMSAVTRPEPPALMNSSNSPVPTATTTLGSLSMPSTTLPTTSLVLQFPTWLLQVLPTVIPILLRPFQSLLAVPARPLLRLAQAQVVLLSHPPPLTAVMAGPRLRPCPVQVLFLPMTGLETAIQRGRGRDLSTMIQIALTSLPFLVVSLKAFGTGSPIASLV